MTDLGPLYHWSPRSRLGSIKSLGLVPGKRNIAGPVRHGPLAGEDSEKEFRQPGICASLDAATAWAYSHGVWRVSGTYDLWQFWLVDTDDVKILPQWGSRIIEVRVHNRIMKRRLSWVGERTIEA